MRYYENIILDKGIKDLKSILKGGIRALDYYAVCVSNVGSSLMEIISVNNMIKDVNGYKNYGIIAVLKSRDAAEIMAAKLIENWLNENDDLNGFKEYYNLKCK